MYDRAEAGFGVWNGCRTASFAATSSPFSPQKSRRVCRLVQHASLVMGWVRQVARVAVVLGCLCLAARWASAQADSTGAAPPIRWILLVDGQAEEWPVRSWPLDSLDLAARTALETFQSKGYFFARLDSARVDSSRTPSFVELYVTRGPEVDVGWVRIEGAAALDSLALRARMNSRAGRGFRIDRLEGDLEALLSAYERAGLPLAEIAVEELRLLPGEPPRVGIRLRVSEGRRLTLQRVEVTGGDRTRASYVQRLANLRPGRPLLGYDPSAIRERLEETGFFDEVGAPELLIDGDSSAVVRIPLEEASPGAFDLVLGYQPSAGGSGSGGLVGNGHLNLRNLFGAGRELSLRLNRLPGRISSVDVRAADPYFVGLPLRLEGRFEGLQQDSTYGKQQYGLEAGYRFSGGIQVYGTVSREVTRPGQAGTRLVAGRQRVPQASALFAGLGFRLQRINDRVNPRTGYMLDSSFEQGRKERTARRVTAEGDTTTERTELRQERLRMQGRFFLPSFNRQVVVLGNDTYLLLSNEYDVSDLFRFGGATTLRGYDEERFLVSFANRAFVEYRYQLDRTSYGFLFFDLGYVERPSGIDLESTKGWFPGYGVGVQIGTDLGLVNLSLAGNPEDPTSVRAHLGLSIGL